MVNKFRSILLCTCSLMYCTRDVQVNGVSGNLCMIQVHEGATVAEVKQLISHALGDDKRTFKLVNDTDVLRETSARFPDEVTNITCLFNSPFVRVIHGEVCFVDKNFRCLFFDSEEIQCTFNRSFPDGEYYMDEFFALAKMFYDEHVKIDRSLHPREFDGINFHYGSYRSCTAKQDVFEKMIETGMMEVFSDKTDTTHYLDKGQMFCLAIEHWGGSTGHTPGLWKMSKDKYLKLSREPDGTINLVGKVSKSIVDFLDRILAED